MTVKNSKNRDFLSHEKGIHFAHLLGLSITIFALYSSSLATMYLISDETFAFSTWAVKRDVVSGFLGYGLVHGRPLTGSALALIADAIDFGEYGLQGLRSLQFVIALLAAIYVFFVMLALRIKPSHALLLTIFLWSQPGVAVHFVFFSVLPHWLGIFCSLLAFSIFLARKQKAWDWREGVAYAVLFVIGLCTYQMTPFFFLGFLAFDILNDRDDSSLARPVRLFLVLLGTVALYTAVFLIISQFSDATLRRQTQQLLDPTDISRFFGSGYLFLFEFWNYPIPIEISKATKLSLLAITAVAWTCLIAAAAVADLRKQKKSLRRWALALACAGASVLPIVADGASGRLHLFLATLPALVLLAYYAGTRLVPESWAGWVRPLLVACLCLVVAGGSLGYQRALVGPAARLFAFIQTEAINQMHPGVKRVLVIRPSSGDMRGLCKYEPCTHFYGRHLATRGHLGARGLYHTALRLAGLPPRLRVKFVDRDKAFRTDAITIDWYRFLRFDRRRNE